VQCVCLAASFVTIDYLAVNDSESETFLPSLNSISSLRNLSCHLLAAQLKHVMVYTRKTFIIGTKEGNFKQKKLCVIRAKKC